MINMLHSFLDTFNMFEIELSWCWCWSCNDDSSRKTLVWNTVQAANLDLSESGVIKCHSPRNVSGFMLGGYRVCSHIFPHSFPNIMCGQKEMVNHCNYLGIHFVLGRHLVETKIGWLIRGCFQAWRW